MNATTVNTAIQASEVDMVADVLLWELMRAGDWDDHVVGICRQTATKIINAQREGAYRHYICRVDPGSGVSG